MRAEFGAGEPLLKTRGRPGCNIEDSKAPRGTREGFQRPQASHLGAEKGPQKRPKKAPRQVFFRGAEKTLIQGTKNMLLSTLWDPKGLPNDSPGPTSGADRKFWIRIRLCVNDDWPMCLYDSEPSPLPIRPTSKQNSEIRKLQISKTRKLENAKPCKLENSTTRTPDNSTTRKLEISTTRELENAKPQKLKNSNKGRLGNLTTRQLENSNARKLGNSKFPNCNTRTLGEKLFSKP